jgi:hypothetical protein
MVELCLHSPICLHGVLPFYLYLTDPLILPYFLARHFHQLRGGEDIKSSDELWLPFYTTASVFLSDYTISQETTFSNRTLGLHVGCCSDVITTGLCFSVGAFYFCYYGITCSIGW